MILPLLTLGQDTNSCKVLVPNLEGKYSGECKNNLADGQGTARGIHIYEGEFNKGYPDGEGKYIWAGNDYYVGTFRKGKRSGYGKHYLFIDGKRIFREGYWQNDAYIGKEKKAQNYSTRIKTGINHVFFTYKVTTDGSNEIMIQFKKSKDGSKAMISDPLIEASSGDLIDQEEKYGFENITFPFTANLSFNVPNETKPDFTSATLNFEIMKEGNWDIVIYF
jgi:hypothetical protein